MTRGTMVTIKKAYMQKYDNVSARERLKLQKAERSYMRQFDGKHGIILKVDTMPDHPYIVGVFAKCNRCNTNRITHRVRFGEDEVEVWKR